jgi:HEAT repeat protein/beta-lactamase regulating signal transducer with metallopeptidase domain
MGLTIDALDLVRDGAWAAAALDAILKATLLLAATALLTHGLRRASAATRHLAWTLAVASALALPALSAMLPRWQVPIVGTVAAPQAWATVTMPGDRTPPALGPQRSDAFVRPGSASAAVPAAPGFMERLASRAGAVGWAGIVLAVWALGAAAILARLAIGMVSVWWIARRRTRGGAQASWLPLARSLARRLGLSPATRFLESSEAGVPMVWGLWRPVVVVPAEAAAWPADRLRIVLLHELAHVKRRDCLTQALAQVACALYWFNPLVWLAARRLRMERERACDDLVLAQGTRGPDYADLLIDVARMLRAGRAASLPGVASATVAMAHRSQLEGRLMAILDPNVPRAGVTRSTAVAAAVLFVLLLVPLAAIQPWAEAATAPPPQGSTPLPDPGPAAVPESRAERAQPALPVSPAAEAAAEGDAQAPRGAGGSATQAVPVPVPVPDVIADAVADALAEVNLAKLVQDAMKGTRREIDPRVLDALIGALKDSDAEVRENALQALAGLRDPRVFEPLVAALRDASADVRSQAAHGLGELRNPRAIDALTAALKDEDPEVREQAVFALGEIRDPRAVDPLAAALAGDEAADVRERAAFALGELRDARAVQPLATALKDASPDVRERAAFALGELRDPRAVEPLVAALRDDHTDVRAQAAFALGEIRDPRAIEPLTAALKDPDVEVRRRAAFALGEVARDRKD